MLSYAVTGTNGKTSTTHFLLQIWGEKAALYGNLGLVTTPDLDVPSTLLPYPTSIKKLQTVLSTYGRKGIFQRITIEAFSRLLLSSRTLWPAIHLNAAGFTNLTLEHLDVHKTLENYFEAKAKLFTEYLSKDAYKVIYADCPYGQQLIERLEGKNCIRYGRSSTYDLRYDEKNLYFEHRAFPLAELPFLGEHMVQNLLCAIGLALVDGVSAERILEAIPTLRLPKGRQEKVYDGDFQIYIDYAHNPEGLEAILDLLRPLTKGRLIVLIRALGIGQRSWLRPGMTKIGCEKADIVFISYEKFDPQYKQAMLENCPTAITAEHRSDIIYQAIAMAKAGDIIVLTGFGHDTGITVNGKIIPYDERAIVKEALAKKFESV